LTPSSIDILHPTFRGKEFFSLKENGVLSFQRINREKGIDLVLDLARNSKENFIIAGAVNKGDEDYYDELNRNKPDNVHIFPNPSEDEKENLFLNAKVFVHTNRKEHFGISIVEAMSHGLVPVVPRSGGPWIDIVERGKFGFGYSDLEELAQVLDQAMRTSERERLEIAESTKRFSPEVFSDTLKSIIASRCIGMF